MKIFYPRGTTLKNLFDYIDDPFVQRKEGKLDQNIEMDDAKILPNEVMDKIMDDVRKRDYSILDLHFMKDTEIHRNAYQRSGNHPDRKRESHRARDSHGTREWA
nr:hypothetical protein [Candidatus Sigynarchaeota archaeon]